MDAGVKISIITAVAENGIIGHAGEIPWRLKSDLRRFANLTRDHTVIVGRKTHESIINRLGHPLRDRKTIVLTRQSDYRVPSDCETATSWEEALKRVRRVRGDKEVFVIGGAEVYRLALPITGKIYLTRVSGSFAGDTFFPALHPEEWELVSEEYHGPQQGDEQHFIFQLWERKSSKTFVNLKNARYPDQLEIMQTIEAGGFCPFCPEHISSGELKPVLKEGKYWHVRENRWPYDNTRIHLLVIHRLHAEKLSDLTPDAAVELFELVKWAEQKYEVRGGALGLRFGDPCVNGATVRHLHVQFMVADITDREDAQYKPVRFRVG